MFGDTKNKYAIVGMGGIFPGAQNCDEYWSNILDKRVFIEKLPDDSVEKEVFFRPEAKDSEDKENRSVTDLLAAIKHIDFDPRQFKIPPKVEAHMDDNQKLALLVANEALSCGALGSVNKDRVSVFMGSTMIGQKHHDFKTRFDCEMYEHYLKAHPAFDAAFSPEQKQQVLDDIKKRILPPGTDVTEDSAPGVLPNIIAARINSVFDFHGHAYVIDAACASGLAAIICGVQQLALGEADAVICGAADRQNSEIGRVYFSGIGALSPNGSFPFDERADGFVVGDGAGAVAIKRLEDAISAGDRIFAVITGYGQASDGKGKAVAAPNTAWQARTIERAWRSAGVPIDTVELIEAHGTSTQVGDISETRALKQAFRALGASKTAFCGLGSVKSNIGHLKSAAGIAGFLKATLALDRGVLPPTAGVEKENPMLELPGSPFYVLKKARAWEEKENPRRAGVSAFGFGGADYHIALEAYRARDYEGCRAGLSISTPSLSAASSAACFSKSESVRASLVYSGVSAGLPGSYKEAFRDDNFEQLFEGRNLIERLDEEEREEMVGLRISKVVKSAAGAAFKELTTLNEVIQLVGKMGILPMKENYHIEEKDIADMSGAVAAATAAGYEALSDARIPLVHEYAETSGGGMLPERWALPREMQADTGIVFANGFPIVEPIIEEVSRHLTAKMTGAARKALFDMYDAVIEAVSDKELRRTLSDWYVQNRQKLGPEPDPNETYRFNHRLITRIAMQANNLLAKYINARGPNFQISAACSSTSTALTLAESLIRTGKARRMIVIGGDDATSKRSVPYLGAGFLSTGACANTADIHEAALPFDKRRDGMIMGAGAVGIVIERDEDCARRGVVPVCELMGTHCFNAAGHSSQLDVPRYADELDKFMTRMEAEHEVSRGEISKKLIYVSHETYTPARGGCAEAEAAALRHTFGDAFRQIEIGNVKGMTGHTMGAALEDAAAAKALQHGRSLPVVNHKVADPVLDGLKLSSGGKRDFQYALRTAAGFGSQGNYILLKRRARGEERIGDAERHAEWIEKISGNDRAELIYRGRILSVKDERPGAVSTDRPTIETSRTTSTDDAEHETPAPEPLPTTPEPEANIKEAVLSTVAEVTGYTADLLEPDMELEADLGIDTVKQATVLAMLAERFSLSQDTAMSMSDFVTVRQLTEFFSSTVHPSSRTGGPPCTPSETIPDISGHPSRTGGPPCTPSEYPCTPSEYPCTPSEYPCTPSEYPCTPSEYPCTPSEYPCTPSESSIPHLRKGVLDILAKFSPYPAEMLEEELSLESDMGLTPDVSERIREAVIERFELPSDWTFPPDSTSTQICDAIRDSISPEKNADALPQWLGRQTPALAEAPNNEAAPFSLAEKSVWILAKSSSCMSAMQKVLEGAKCKITQCLFPAEAADDTFRQTANALMTGKGPDVIIDLTATPVSSPILSMSEDEVRFATARAMDGRFALYRRLAEKNRRPERILAVTALGGRFFIDDKDTQTASPLYGFYIGFYKALQKEWPDTAVSVLDLPVSAWRNDAAEATSQINAELSVKGRGIEICYVNDVRHRVIAQNLSWDEVDRTGTLGQGEVIVASGGGTGITARILKALCKKAPAAVALIGSTRLDKSARGLVAEDAAAMRAEKEAIRARLDAKGNRVTPVMIEQALKSRLRSAEILRTLDDLFAAGSKAAYFCADIRDPDALEAALSQIRGELGPVTTVINGAGIEESRLLDKKSPEEFKRVYGIKAAGAYQMLRLCQNDPLRRIVNISSVAGRFGNAAQIDYSGANAFLDLLSRTEQRPGIRAVSLLFSGWSECGMAWQNSFVREHAETGGLNLIEPDAGAAAAAAAVTDDKCPREVIIHRGLKYIAGPDETDLDLSDFPLVDWVDRRDGKITSVYRRFSPARDAFLDQHRLANTPLMPGVGLMEMMAEAMRLIEPRTLSPDAVVFRDLVFKDAFKFYKDAPRDVRIDLYPKDRGVVEMVVNAVFKPVHGGEAQTREYCRAKVSCVSPETAPPRIVCPNLENAKVSSWSSLLDAAAGRRRDMRLGPLFNEARRPKAVRLSSSIRWNENGIETTAPLPKEQLSNPDYPLEQWLINPAFLDTLHQVGAVAAAELTGRVYLPVGADTFTVYRAPNENDLFRAAAELVRLDDETARYDMSMAREDGLVCATVQGSLFKRIND